MEKGLEVPHVGRRRCPPRPLHRCRVSRLSRRQRSLHQCVSLPQWPHVQVFISEWILSASCTVLTVPTNISRSRPAALLDTVSSSDLLKTYTSRMESPCAQRGTLDMRSQ